ncbi:MarR family winged helix-turn-helix transcriptional regulator [Alkalilacustris brevis]|uniref:MarR family winged helix-turn-helix transcriptional regulator n=1 Tax=Alkalilacustris brevis TaxID=2026338 RepID=UPI000E0D0824|nr:MarR family transcriptional regulator [Alkalilacustris brevis]
MKRSEISLIALRRILRATEQHGRALAAASGLTPVQMRVLKLLQADGRSTPKTLASQLRVSQATVTALLDRLETKRMILRERSAQDRRQTNITLSQQGVSAIDDAPDPLQEQFVTRFEALADWEQAMIVAALERVADMMDASEIDASPVLDVGDIRRGPPDA